MACADERVLLIAKIEDVCLNVMEQIMRGQPPELVISRKRDWSTAANNSAGHPHLRNSTGSQPALEDASNSQSVPCNTDRSSRVATRDTIVRFSNRRSVAKFGAMMKVLSSIYSLLIEDRYCTKRDLYYQDPELYGNQRYVDQLVDSISSMFRVPRWHLHVVATSKGVIAGDLMYLDADRKLVDCSKTQNVT